MSDTPAGPAAPDRPATSATPDTAATPAASGPVQGLGVRVEAMRAVLVRLLQDVVRAEARLFANGHDATLVAVNEQLVVAALLSRSEADASA